MPDGTLERSYGSYDVGRDYVARLSQQREAVEHENRILYERLGRPIRSSILACAVTARRAARRGVSTASRSPLALRPVVA